MGGVTRSRLLDLLGHSSDGVRKNEYAMDLVDSEVKLDAIVQ